MNIIFSYISIEIFLVILLSLIWVQIYVKIFWKRSFAKINGIDFISTLAIGSVLASTMLQSDTSLVRWLIVIGSILLFQSLLVWIYHTFPIIKKLLTNQATYLIQDWKILTENLKKSWVSYENLMVKLRWAGISKLDQVGAAVFETTGDISIIKSHDIDEAILYWIKK